MVLISNVIVANKSRMWPRGANYYINSANHFTVNTLVLYSNGITGEFCHHNMPMVITTNAYGHSGNSISTWLRNKHRIVLVGSYGHFDNVR